jgi:hypothetical protein
VNVHVAPGENVLPAQFWTEPKLALSDGAPPANEGVCDAGLMLVTTTSRVLVAPTAVSGNDRLVGATLNGKRPEPDIEMAKFSPSMPIAVFVDNDPSDFGWNRYVNVQLSPGANVLPAQFWTDPKFVPSDGAPPANPGDCDVELTFVTATAISVVAPMYVAGNDSVVGATVKSPGAARAGTPPSATSPIAAASRTAATVVLPWCRGEVFTGGLYAPVGRVEYEYRRGPGCRPPWA